MSDALRLGLVGLGDFGMEHLHGVLAGNDFHIMAVADPRRAHTEYVADRHGIPHRFSNGSSLVRSGTVDAIAVVSPASTHLSLAKEAAGRGIAVLLEKPVVADLAEAAQLLELDRAGIVVPAHILRSGDPYRAANKSILDRGLRIGGLSARRHRPIDHLSRFPNSDPAFMSMVHDIDLAIWYTGSLAVSVRARSHGVRDPRRIDTVLATISDDADRTWDIGSSWTVEADGPPDRFEIYTDQDLLVIDGSGFDAEQSMCDQYRHFAAVIHGQASLVPVRDAVHGIAVAEAVLRSARSGGEEVLVATTREITQMAGTAR